MNTKSLMKYALQRFLENFLSVKVWVIIWPFIISTILLKDIYETQFRMLQSSIHFIKADPKLICDMLTSSFTLISETFKSWLTFNLTLVGSIVVVREIFKVPRINGKSEGEGV